MGISDPDTSTGVRRRQLSIIYFVDAARTRTVTIPLGRLRLMLAGLATLVAWSLASAVLTWHFIDDQARLTQRLKVALSSIFEYETRDDHVFDIAYPAVKAAPRAPAVAAAKPGEAPAPAPVAKASEAARGVASVAATSRPPEATQATVAPPARSGPLTPVASTQPADRTAVAVTPSHGDEPVAIGHPEVKVQGSQLDLSFELTSKSATSRVEGRIYAVAEFTSEQGQRSYIPAPGEVALTADGDAIDPHKAAVFGIRRFKQKRFHFPLANGKAGMFTRVRIVVLDRAGVHKNTYDIPLSEPIGAGHEQSRVHQPRAPKPG